MSARVVRPDALDRGEIDLWSSFCRSDPSLAHPFFSYAFVRAAGRAHPRVFVAVIEREGRPVGFLPFQFKGRMEMMMRAAERAGAPLADRFGLVAADDLNIGSAELLALAGLNSLRFFFLPAAQARHGFSMQRAVAGQHVRLHGDPDSFWSDLKATSRKFASQVERNERLIAKELGPLKMTLRAEPALELDRLVAVKAAQYERTGRENPLKAAWTADLFRELLRSDDPGCTGALSTLYAGDTWLASHLGVMSQAVFHYWYPVYNVEYARFSPGHILTKHLVLAAVSGGMGYFDMAGYGQYKDHFRPEPYVFHAGFWRGRGLGGFINQVGTSLSWRLARLRERGRHAADAGGSPAPAP